MSPGRVRDQGVAESAQPKVCMIADLSDPVAKELAGRLPVSAWVRNQAVESEWPERPPEPLERADWLILHRTGLPRSVLTRLRRWRLMLGRWPATVLILGPHVRYADIEPWSDLADEVIDEPAALAALERRWLIPKSRRRRARVVPPRLETASQVPDNSEDLPPSARRISLRVHDAELRLWLREWLAARGENVIDELPRWVSPVSDPNDPQPDPQTLETNFNPTRMIWEVPTLDPSWPETLSRLSRQGGRVLALIGLADRDQVAQARESGAAAVLDLPCDPDDLTFVLDRLEPQPNPTTPAVAEADPHGSRPSPVVPPVPPPSPVAEESRRHAR